MINDSGVDVVLNSLGGEPLRQSWHCLAWFGRFIEMGKKDIGKCLFNPFRLGWLLLTLPC